MGDLIQPSPAIFILEEQRLGYFGLSVSNFDTTGIPEIIGNVEVAGALYTFPALEAIADWASMSAGAVWVKLAPQLDDTVDAIWTDVAPEWSDEKQGWYSPALGEENQRYVFSATKVDASNVVEKRAIELRITAAHAILANEAKNVLPKNIVILSSGSGNWTVPLGVSRLKVFCVGGGGGGGGCGTFFSQWFDGPPGSTGGTTTFGALSGLGGLGGFGGFGVAPGIGARPRAGVAGSVGGLVAGSTAGGSGGGSGGGGAGASSAGGGGGVGGPGAGGGGAGGYSYNGTDHSNGGGGGGGTVLTEDCAHYLDVTPGQVIAYAIGSGGAGGGSGGAGGDGFVRIEY